MDISGKMIIHTLPSVRLSAFRAGQIFTGSVSAVDSDGKALINFKSFQISVENAGLTPGDLVSGKIINKTNGHALHITKIHQNISKKAGVSKYPLFSLQNFRHTGSMINKIPEHFHIPQNRQDLLIQIQNWFSPLNLAENVDSLTQKLIQFIEGFGYFLEKKIARQLVKNWESKTSGASSIQSILKDSLKAQLLSLKALSFNNKSFNEADAILKSTEHILNFIERHEQSEKDYADYLYPLPMPQPFQEAVLRMRYSRGQEHESNGAHAELFVIMDNIGAICADFWKPEPCILYITFFLSDETQKSLFENAFPELEKRISENFTHIKLKAIHSEQRIQAFMLSAFDNRANEGINTTG